MSEPAITDATFGEIVELIAASRQRAVQAVNSQLIDLYWQVGAIISRKLRAAEWGDGVVPQLAAYLARTQPGLRGFTARNLFRMRQFYEAYQDQRATGQIVSAPLTQLPAPTEIGATGLAKTAMSDAGGQLVPALLTQLPAATGRGSSDAGSQIVAALLRQLPWTHHLIILGQCKRSEEREFYLRMAIREGWSSRELERQLKGALFERSVLHPPKASQAIAKNHAAALAVFKDAYLVEFLGLPAEHKESDLHRGLLLKLKDFLIELGRDFCFVGSEFPVQVGGRDFALDLLFFHRGLNALVAIELKVGRFEPEYLGKLSFYLEALDRDVKKPHENPAIGVLLCASKDEEVVEYALSRTLSPALIAQYSPQLPDKELLVAKLHEFYLQDAPEEDLP
jgi:predicted nuclease of restriction endonuclease-like (RecB) superfamily